MPRRIFLLAVLLESLTACGDQGSTGNGTPADTQAGGGGSSGVGANGGNAAGVTGAQPAGQAGAVLGGSGGRATGGSGGRATGGSGGRATGGSGGRATGGSAGDATLGGTTAEATGGADAAVGGSGGVALGGSAGRATGGSAGAAPGGTAGRATGGSASAAPGGTGGQATGGGGGNGMDCRTIQCLRPYVCVDYCGSTNVLNNGCCACPDGMIDDIQCPAPTVSQGVSGTVLWLEGNHMPGSGSSSGITKPVSREVRIYQAVHEADVVAAAGRPSTLYDAVNATLVATTTSDEATGFYEVALDPGTYSVLVEDEGDWYCNSFSAAGLCTVTVNAGSVASFLVRIDYAASY